MNKSIQKIKLEYLKKNIITYQNIMALQENECVKVNKTYFSCLVAMNRLLQNQNKKFWNIIFKYEKIENIKSKSKKNTNYFLMSSNDIKYLITNSKYKINLKVSFLKTDITVDELENQNKKLSLSNKIK